MFTVEVVGWAATLIGTLLGLPQAVRLARTRSVEGLSLTAWQAVLAVNVGWTQHGLRIGQAPMILTSALSLCSTVPILIMMSRTLNRSFLRVMLPSLIAAAGMIAIDRGLGTAAYGTAAVLPAVLANLGLSVARAPRAARRRGLGPVPFPGGRQPGALAHLGRAHLRRRHRHRRRRHRDRRRLQPRVVAGTARRTVAALRHDGSRAPRGPRSLVSARRRPKGDALSVRLMAHGKPGMTWA